MKTPCAICGNTEFREVTTQYIYQRHEQLMVVEDVPALACTNCGEKYFDIKTLKDIEARFQDIYQHGKPPTEQRAVPFERWGSCGRWGESVELFSVSSSSADSNPPVPVWVNWKI